MEEREIEEAESYKDFEVGNYVKAYGKRGRIVRIWRYPRGPWRFWVYWDGDKKGRNFMVGDLHNVYPSWVTKVSRR